MRLVGAKKDDQTVWRVGGVSYFAVLNDNDVLVAIVEQVESGGVQFITPADSEFRKRAAVLQALRADFEIPSEVKVVK
jgi:hypothetical protein